MQTELSRNYELAVGFGLSFRPAMAQGHRVLLKAGVQ